jgi:hypothetical protein
MMNSAFLDRRLISSCRTGSPVMLLCAYCRLYAQVSMTCYPKISTSGRGLRIDIPVVQRVRGEPH